MTFSREEKRFSKKKGENASMFPLQMRNSETLKTEKIKKNNYNEKEFNNKNLERKNSVPNNNSLEKCKNFASSLFFLIEICIKSKF